MSKSSDGPGRFLYINDLKNSWYLEYGNLEYPAYVEVFEKAEALILPGLSRSGAIFPVSWT